MGALSFGILGATSCVRSSVAGYLYVTGNAASQPNGNGIISGFEIDHNTGQLTPVDGLPISTGGANPVRAVLADDSRFVYVLNRGLNASGTSDCTTANPCQNANITQFAVNGNGTLTPKETFYTQGFNPFRLIADTANGYLLVLDHDSPDNYASTYNPATNGCTLALGTGVKTCGDITVFSINQATGVLSPVTNAQITVAQPTGTVPLTYFPVPVNPVDLVLTGTSVLTLSSATAASAYPYTGGSSVWPYAYSSGQLTATGKSSQPLNILEGTAIVNAGGLIYVLDNEPITYTNASGEVITSSSQILPFTVGTNGSLQPEPGGIVPDDPALSNPTQLLLESKGHFLYVANQGKNVTGSNPESGIAGYFVTTSPSYELAFIPGEPFSSGSGPQCIVEDPSDQFIYTANYDDSTVTGRIINPNAGVLNDMRVGNVYPLTGPPTWCFVDADGRTQ